MQIPDIKPRFASCVIALITVSSAACDSRLELRTPPSVTASGNVIRGKNLIAQYQCGACHMIPGVLAARGIVGPPLSDFGRRSYIAGHIPNSPELLAQWIVAPRSMVPNTTMPSMGVSADDARDMSAYLHTLR